jgi:hypothetical protein
VLVITVCLNLITYYRMQFECQVQPVMARHDRHPVLQHPHPSTRITIRGTLGRLSPQFVGRPNSPKSKTQAPDVAADSKRDTAWLASIDFEVIAVESLAGMRDEAQRLQFSAQIQWLGLIT